MAPQSICEWQGELWPDMNRTGPARPVQTIQGDCIFQYNVKGSKALLTPTADIYLALDQAFYHFNRDLFESALSAPVITLAQKGRRTSGFLRSKRFEQVAAARTADELAMNPWHFSLPVETVLTTLCHQMIHLWQTSCGMPSRAGYHNRQWADQAKKIGLHPSENGMPGGR